MPALDQLPTPSVTFASDNSAPVHPAVMEALGRANTGHALAYGYDRWTADATAALVDLLGVPAQVFFTWSGTGANVLALTSCLTASQAVICSANAHISVDEAGAPERIAGAKLIDLPTADGKLRPEHVAEQLHALGNEHHAQPRVVSVTQSSELGTVYSADELSALCELAHANAMVVHVDGARIANATVAAGGDVRRLLVETGVDVVSFGGTKNGLMYGEAVVYLNAELARYALYLRKQVGQLASKARYIAAQFSALLNDGLWLELAGHANAMTRRLYDAVAGIDGVIIDRPPEVNSLFPRLPRKAADALVAWSPFYVWEERLDQFRWMTSWDTTPEDVDRFAAGVAAAMEEHGHG